MSTTNKTIAKIIILFAIISTNEFFFLLPSELFSFQDFALIYGLIAVFILGTAKNKNFYYSAVLIASFSILVFILTLIMSRVTFNQPIIYSIRASRILLGWVVMSLLLSKYFEKYFTFTNYNIYLTVFSIFLIILHYYVFFSGNVGILFGLRITERFDEVRFLIAPTFVIFLTIYFSKKITHPFSLNFVFFIAFLGIILLISKTRGILFPLLIVLSFRLLNRKKAGTNILIIGGLITISLVFYDFLYKYFTQYFGLVSDEMSSGSSNLNNVTIRLVTLVFYSEKMDFINWIMGYGIENKLYITDYEEFLTVADIGIFKVIYHHGLIGLSLLLFFYIKLFKLANQSKTTIGKSIKSFVIFQLLCSPTIVFIYGMDGIFINLLFYYYLLYEKTKTKYYYSSFSLE